MADHPLKGLMTTSMENLKEMIDVNVILGDPVETPDGGVILTVSKVGFGFAAGGSEFSSSSSDSGGDTKFPFGGGSGGGVSISPIAFLIVNSQGVKMLHVDQNTHIYEKLLDLAPNAVDKFQQMLGKNKGNAQQGQQNQGQVNSNQGQQNQSKLNSQQDANNPDYSNS